MSGLMACYRCIQGDTDTDDPHLHDLCTCTCHRYLRILTECGGLHAPQVVRVRG